MNQPHSTIAQSIAPFMPGAIPATEPTWAEIVQVVASFKEQAKAATLCADAECCSFGQPRAGSCACSQGPAAQTASALLAASLYAERAHRAHERRALNLQMNEKTGAFQ